MTLPALIEQGDAIVHSAPPLRLVKPAPDPYADWEDAFNEEQHRMDHSSNTGDGRPMALVRKDGHGKWDLMVMMPEPARTPVVGDIDGPDDEEDGE